MNKILENSYRLIMIIAFIVLGLLAWKGGVRVFGELERLRNNQEALKQELGGRQRVEALLKGEFKKYYEKLDSVANSIGIKTRQIENVTRIVHKTYIDTIFVELEPEVDALDRIRLHFDKNCMKADGYIDFSKTSIRIAKEDIGDLELVLTDVRRVDETVTFYFWERKTKRFLFMNLKLGRKQYWVESKSACGDSLEVKGIDIVKKGRSD